MRKVLVDEISEASMLTDVPLGEQRTPKISEPDAANVGKSGLGGVGRHIYSRQELAVEIEKSGSLSGIRSDVGGRFIFTPDYLKNAAGTEKTDQEKKVGAVYRQHLHHSQVIKSSANEIASVCLCRLEHWDDAEANAGNVALLGYMQEDGSNNWTPTILVMKAEPEGYKWEAATTLTVRAEGATNRPGMDMVEMPDGTVICTVFVASVLYVYRSFDGGETFDLVSTQTSVSAGGEPTTGCTVERIGTRIVCVTGVYDGGDQIMYSHVSNDMGETWTLNTEIFNVTTATVVFRGKLVRGHDGWLYLFFRYLGDPYVNKTRDGTNWFHVTGTAISTTNCDGVTGVQTREGSWWVFFKASAGHGNIEATERNDVDAYGTFDAEYTVDPQNADITRVTNYARMLDVDCDRVFNDSFTELAAIEFDDHGSTNYMIVTYRLGMWSGISHDDDTENSIVWTAHHYPSETDPAPDIDTWVKTASPATTPASLVTGDLGYLRLQPLNLETEYYTITNALNGFPAAGSWTNGIVVKAELKMVSGDFHIRIRLNDGATNQNDVMVIFNTGNIQIYDNVAGGGTLLLTFTPVNWDPQEWNTFWIVIQSTSMYIFRSPTDVYREILPMEACGEVDDGFATEASGATGVQLVEWGHIDVGLAPGNTDAFVRSIQIYGNNCNDGFGVTTNMGSNVQGKRSTYDPLGLLQGLSAKFGGEFAVDADKWSLDVGEVYSAENVFVSSPSVLWKEPAQTAGVDSPARVFTITRGQDDNAEELSFPAYGVALFNRNFLDFKVEGKAVADGPTNWMTLFDSTGSPGYGWKSNWEVKSNLQDNKFMAWPLSGSPAGSVFAPMVPNQFASDGLRNWYIKMTTGSAANKIYKIVANDTDWMYFDINVEQDGVAATDEFVIFSSSFFFEFASEGFYEMLRLTIPTQSRYVKELSLQLGTLMYGRVIELDDDAWGASYGLEPNNTVVRGPSGREVVTARGPMRRTVSLKYTGQADEGMGAAAPIELHRLLGGGVVPLAWLDHDDELDVTGHGHHNPLLCKALNPVNAQHVSYQRVDESTADGMGYGVAVHNVFDMSLKLREEL